MQAHNTPTEQHSEQTASGETAIDRLGTGDRWPNPVWLLLVRSQLGAAVGASDVADHRLERGTMINAEAARRARNVGEK